MRQPEPARFDEKSGKLWASCHFYAGLGGLATNFTRKLVLSMRSFIGPEMFYDPTLCSPS